MNNRSVLFIGIVIFIILGASIVFFTRCKVSFFTPLFANGPYACTASAAQSLSEIQPLEKPVSADYISVKFKEGVNILNVLRRNNVPIQNLGDKDAQEAYKLFVPSGMKAKDLVGVLSQDPDVKLAK